MDARAGLANKAAEAGALLRFSPNQNRRPAAIRVDLTGLDYDFVLEQLGNHVPDGGRAEAGPPREVEPADLPVEVQAPQDRGPVGAPQIPGRPLVGGQDASLQDLDNDLS